MLEIALSPDNMGGRVDFTALRPTIGAEHIRTCCREGQSSFKMDVAFRAVIFVYWHFTLSSLLLFWGRLH